jgi:TonB family protein
VGLISALLALGACGPYSKVEPETLGPPVPTSFVPGEKLGAEPTPPEGLAGNPWLEAVHERFYVKWSEGFLEQSRMFLPPTHPLNDRQLAVTLELTVGADGTLLVLTPITSSGNADFDAAAKQVISDSAPFPAPPAELQRDDGNFYVTWLFARDNRQAAVANARFDKRLWPPERAVPAMLASGRWRDASRRLAQTIQGTADAGQLKLGRDIASFILLAALSREASPAQRSLAIDGARRSKLAQALPAIRALAKGAVDLGVRAMAMRALGELGDADSSKLLEDAVAGADGDRSIAAALGLAALGQKDEVWARLAPKLDDPAAAVRMGALKTLAAVAPAGCVPVLAAILLKPSIMAGKPASRAERAAAALALGTALAGGANDAGRPLIIALDDGDAAVRAATMAALTAAGRGGYRSKGAFYKIILLIKERDPAVRAQAVRALAAVFPTGAASELAVITRKEKQRVVKLALIDAMVILGDPTSLKTLISWSQGKGDPSLRPAAIKALSLRHEPEAKAALAAMIDAKEPDIRVIAVAASTDTAALHRALTDESSVVRASAIERLAALEGPAGVLPVAIEGWLGASTPEAVLQITSAFLVASQSR